MTTDKTLKYHLYHLFEETAVNRVASQFIQQALVMLIVVNVVLAVIETLPAVREAHGGLMSRIQIVSGTIFLLEYLVRLYVADMHPPLRRYGPLGARLRYAVQPDAIIDLIAALPLVMVLLLPTNAVTVIVILRLLRFLKLARYSPAIRSLLQALASERWALMGATLIVSGVILLAATVMHLVEGEAQPDKFQSIPHAMWWAIATVTTVGYGDVVPVTGLGKMIGSFFMLLGYGLIALPVGIIASAFAREMHSRDFVVSWSMVARVPIFEDLKAAEIAEVAKLLRAQKVKAGSVIADKGDVADRMFFISEGNIEIELGHKTVYLDAGDFFGELSMIHQRPRTARIKAFHDTELLVLEAQSLHHLMEKKPDLAAKILAEAGRRHAETLNAMGDLVSEEIAQADVVQEDENSSDEPELFVGKEDRADGTAGEEFDGAASQGDGDAGDSAETRETGNRSS
ncbi:cyclic nucleotide-gated ion channel [Roseibium sp.]|uniref:cyclic nucleotide-gated ion channel n=1 Tax=Roseibium sp. TaxID=1936156 RepID=UPI003A970C35